MLCSGVFAINTSMLLRELFSVVSEARRPYNAREMYIRQLKKRYDYLYNQDKSKIEIEQILAQEFGLGVGTIEGDLIKFYPNRPGKEEQIPFSDEEEGRAKELFLQQIKNPRSVTFAQIASILNTEFHDGNEVRTVDYVPKLKNKMVRYNELPPSALALKKRVGIADTDFDTANSIHYAWIFQFRELKKKLTRKGISFEITEREAYEQIKKQGWVSALTGQPFSLAPKSDDAPSLKLLIPERGYVSGNFEYVTTLERNQPDLALIKEIGLDIKNNYLHLFFYKNFIQRKSNSKKDNIPFKLPISRAWQIINDQNWRCALSGREFSRSQIFDNNQPSLDQIIPWNGNPKGNGYTDGNSQYLTLLVQYSKRDLNNDQYRDLCQRVVEWTDRDRSKDSQLSSPDFIDRDPRRKTYRGERLPGYRSTIAGHSSWNRNFNNMVKNDENMYHQPRQSLISKEEAWKIINDQGWRCALTGELMVKAGPRSFKQPSPDRIDNNRHHVSGNVRYVTMEVNLAKGNMSDEEFIALCREVVAFRTKNR
jgi:hypothetical protein